MTGGRYLLDTNIAIPFLARDETIVGRFNETIEVFVPSVVIGEMYYGAFHSARASENVSKVSEFALSMQVLGCDLHTARKYGEVKAELRGLGKPIPENDLWIAALALQHDLILVSRDRHFSHILGLQFEDWLPKAMTPG